MYCIYIYVYIARARKRFLHPLLTSKPAIMTQHRVLKPPPLPINPKAKGIEP